MPMRLHRPVATDTEADKAAIERAIVSDFDSYLARDKPLWETHWVQDERLISIVDCGPRIVSHGYAAFRENFFRSMDMDPNPDTPRVRRENMTIHVDGDMAWAHFEQHLHDSADPILPPSFTYNIRVFERHGEDWKVVFHGVWSLPGREMAAPAIEVDANAGVLWINPAAQARLAGFPALTISHGKLRTSAPGLQTELEEALTRAAALQDYVSYRQAERDPQADVSFPVLLGEDEHGGLSICRALVSGGRIYVCFGEDERIAGRIRQAAIIFGLSDAQHRIAGHIADGLSLDAAARAMDISVNTARTHLRRMFDKTGARNQAALLRLFLAMG